MGVIPELLWRSCFWSWGWIHGSLPATQCCHPCILSINFLSVGNRLISSFWSCFFAWGPGFWLDWFLIFFGEVAFGAGAEFMAADQSHSVVAPTSLVSTSFELETDSYCLVDVVFLLEVQDFDWSDSWASLEKLFLELGLNLWQLSGHIVLLPLHPQNPHPVNQKQIHILLLILVFMFDFFYLILDLSDFLWRSLHQGSGEIWFFRINVTRRLSIFIFLSLPKWSLWYLDLFEQQLISILFPCCDLCGIHSILLMKQFFREMESIGAYEAHGRIPMALKRFRNKEWPGNGWHGRYQISTRHAMQ